jgi:hypothetical protein
MQTPLFASFRLIGGTALSLQLGHRISVDIDLFTDAQYGTIDFDAIDQYLKSTFSYVDTPVSGIVGIGVSYFIGNSKIESIKLDLYYTDTFIQPPHVVDNIRMASMEEIIAMKLDIIQRGGRKKDFWDIHQLLDHYMIPDMIALHKQRYPYNHEPEIIKINLTDFSHADNDFDPVCLHGKHWELIKLDIVDTLR